MAYAAGWKPGMRNGQTRNMCIERYRDGIIYQIGHSTMLGEEVTTPEQLLKACELARKILTRKSRTADTAKEKP